MLGNLCRVCPCAQTCAALHNVLMMHDGLDTIGSHTSDWCVYDKDTDWTRIERDSNVERWPVDVGDETPPADGHCALREVLIEHFQMQHNEGTVHWLKPASVVRPSKHRAPLPSAEWVESEVERRADNMMEDEMFGTGGEASDDELDHDDDGLDPAREDDEWF